MTKYVIQVTACPLDSPGLRDGIEQFTEISMAEYGAPESDYWFHREQQGSTLAADANGRWYLTCCNILETTTRDRLFPVGKWPVEEMMWHYEDHKTRPNKQQRDEYYDRVLHDSDLTAIGPRGPLDEMFAGTWKFGDRDYREYIQETIRAKRTQLDKKVCLRPKAPLIHDDQSVWYGVIDQTPSSLSAMQVNSTSSNAYISHVDGSSEMLLLWLDDPLHNNPVQRGSVRSASLRMKYRSSGAADRCLIDISSPTVFSAIQIMSVASNEWQTKTVQLNLESASYADWADLGLRIRPVNLSNDCGPTEISFVEICLDWERD